jgi:ubiquinone biosynthesis protein COQ9
MQQNRHEAILNKILALSPFPEWRLDAIYPHIAEHTSYLELNILFPNDTEHLLQTYFEYLNAQLENAPFLENTGTTGKIKQAMQLHLAHLNQHPEAAHAAINTLITTHSALYIPQYVLQITNTMWVKAADTSTDMNYYTKRIILGSIYAATLAYWHTTNADTEKTMAFFNQRLRDLFKLTHAVKTITPNTENLQKNLRILKAMLWS